MAGGAGFIGSHIVRGLLSGDQQVCVTVLDDFSTGSMLNLKDWASDSRLRIIECDIALTLPEIKRPDLILHLATCANPRDYEVRPLATLLVNSRGNENLLELARVSRSGFVYFSSSEVYGSHDPMPPEGLREESSSRIQLGTNRSPYAVGKAFGEELVQTYCSQNNLDCLVIRPFNVYGPGMDWNTPYGRVIPNFLRWATAHEPLRVNGDGSQERSFCYIDDFVDCMLALLNERLSGNQVVNIGNPEPISVLHLAKLVNEITCNPAGIEYAMRYVHEPKYRTPDVTRAMQLTGWAPHTSLRDGLLRMASCLDHVESAEEVVVQ